MSASPVCVDASFVAHLFMGPKETRAWELLNGWWEQKVPLYSPALLHYELTNALYRYHRARWLSLVTVELILEAAAQLPIGLESHESLTRAALRIASTLGLSATYDAYYLAVAEKYDADLWTADGRLRQEVGEYGIRVRLLERTEAG